MCVLTHENQVVMQMTSQFLSFPSTQPLKYLVFTMSATTRSYEKSQWTRVRFRPGGINLDLNNVFYLVVSKQAATSTTAAAHELSIILPNFRDHSHSPMPVTIYYLGSTCQWMPFFRWYLRFWSWHKHWDLIIENAWLLPSLCLGH